MYWLRVNPPTKRSAAYGPSYHPAHHDVTSTPPSPVIHARQPSSFPHASAAYWLVTPLEDQDVTTSQYDDHIQKFTAPFFMAGINTRVVRRSAANLAYGPGQSAARRSLHCRHVSSFAPSAFCMPSCAVACVEYVHGFYPCGC